MSAARGRWGRFFLVDLGRGAAVNGMQIEINTWYSSFFLSITLYCPNAFVYLFVYVKV